MFSLFNKSKKVGEKVTFKLSGLHCSSCSLNIDDALEDTPGVISSKTSYAKQESVVEYDSTQVQKDKLKAVITDLGYSVM